MSDGLHEADAKFAASMDRRFGAAWRRDEELSRFDAACDRQNMVDGVVQVLFIVAVCVLLSVALVGCGDTINPVRYQTQPVLVVKPCFAGRTPPAEAATLTTTTCDANGDCAVTCSDPRPEACVTHATADILELQREARQYRNLFRECSK